MMNARRSVAAVAALGLPSVALLGLTPGPALAHGAMQTPPSRALLCREENPEAPRSAACKAAVAVAGAQPFYDWNEVNLPDVAGRHRERIPDGRLCGAGRDKYRGLDLPRADWPATRLTGGAAHTFRYRATAPHRGSFELYATRDGYDPARPLRWSDLEPRPFLRVQDPPLANGAYVMRGTLPAKRGRHLVYAIWQRSDSPEAFYSCSDVVFAGGAAAPAPGAPAQAPARPPAAAPTPVCPVPSRAAHAGHGASVTLQATPAAGTSPDGGGSPFGTSLITGVLGLALGGVAGLLLTARRRA